ncbi:uracil-DNA glycosylase [Christensenellaceae bacterium OttesenSCG-928-M15]|nr:uracil-DNA glycosylase [Christensenellaceae bacterium OttesenSCG-928-M15]
MRMTWEYLEEQVEGCAVCPLFKSRTHTAFGEGNRQADILFIGEGPGREEDLQGRPFVGPAGQLLDKMLAAIGLKREEVYIANIVKCRPPQNRTPVEEEAQACLPYLRAQTALIKPKIIVCLGATAARYVYDPQIRITRERGIWKEKKGISILPTYHPAALLRDPQKKHEAWADFQSLRDKYAQLLAAVQ